MFRRLLSTFTEGDNVIIRPLKHISLPFLLKPLAKGAVAHTNHGKVHHDDIIGQPKRVFLQYRASEKKKDNQKAQKDTSVLRYVATEPTLDEYTSMVPREAQPIYTLDANSIVSLAGIDVDIPEESLSPKHFLEAGTGNGSLTLSICSAIHGANALARHFGDVSKRGAVLHSVDRREEHLKMGSKNVHNYRKGKYAGDVEFGLFELPTSFLELHPDLELHGVFLDLPNPDAYLRPLSTSMALDATLIVFCPSVTQILACRQILADARLANDPIDLVLVKTVELPPGNGGGTREWDVNIVFTRETGEKAAICRPKVGARVVGGGFVGVFKKLSVVGESLARVLGEKT